MLYLIIAMFVIVVLAVLTVVFVAFPFRGRDIPNAVWLSNAMGSAADRIPLDDEYAGQSPYAGETRVPAAPESLRRSGPGNG
jgi:hypothetical protein